MYAVGISVLDQVIYKVVRGLILEFEIIWVASNAALCFPASSSHTIHRLLEFVVSLVACITPAEFRGECNEVILIGRSQCKLSIPRLVESVVIEECQIEVTGEGVA